MEVTTEVVLEKLIMDDWELYHGQNKNQREPKTIIQFVRRGGLVVEWTRDQWRKEQKHTEHGSRGVCVWVDMIISQAIVKQKITHSIVAVKRPTTFGDC